MDSNLNKMKMIQNNYLLIKYSKLARYTVKLRIISAASNSDDDPQVCLQSIQRQ